MNLAQVYRSIQFKNDVFIRVAHKMFYKGTYVQPTHNLRTTYVQPTHNLRTTYVQPTVPRFPSQVVRRLYVGCTVPCFPSQVVRRLYVGCATPSVVRIVCYVNSYSAHCSAWQLSFSSKKYYRNIILELQYGLIVLSLFVSEHYLQTQTHIR
jgi:hypothetical protein